MKFLNILMFVLLVVGGLNWGLVGLFQFDLVAAIFGPMTLAANIVYILVGVSAIYAAVMFSRGCCSSDHKGTNFTTV